MAALALVAALAAGLVVAASPRRPATAQDAPAVTVQRAHAASATPTLKRRIVVLTIGSDAGAPKFGRGGAWRAAGPTPSSWSSSTPSSGAGSMLSFPRDSYVPIPGYGTNKINAAMAFGGPRLLVATFEQLTGLTIDYYALTSFDGLTDIVNKVGEVQVNVDMNLRDTFAGAFLDKGRRKLNGGQALAYARARKTLPGGDFDRSRHQGQLLLGGLGHLPAPGRRGPGQGHDLARRHPRRGQDRPARSPSCCAWPCWPPRSRPAASGTSRCPASPATPAAPRWSASCPGPTRCSAASAPAS